MQCTISEIVSISSHYSLNSVELNVNMNIY